MRAFLFLPPIYKTSMEKARWGAASPGNACPSAQDRGQFLRVEGHTCSLPRAFTSHSMSVSKSTSDELTDPQGAGGVGEFRWAYRWRRTAARASTKVGSALEYQAVSRVGR